VLYQKINNKHSTDIYIIMLLWTSKTVQLTSCVISDKMLSTESLSKFSELVISMTGNSSGYLSVYVN